MEKLELHSIGESNPNQNTATPEMFSKVEVGCT
jgi:hypothetical protein